MDAMRRAAIIAALRTPVGRYGGALAPVSARTTSRLMSIRAVVDRTGIDPQMIDDVYFGAANQSGEDNRNVARMAALLAGFPETVPGTTVNRLCASGLEAINIAARMIEANQGDVFLAGGVESMSRAPYVLSKAPSAYARTQELYDTSIGWRFVHRRMDEMGHTDALGVTAEHVAKTLRDQP
jgi:acetyl-CoA acetyltransferase